ncbi:hypothetical protein H0H81_011364 [Sphagnurus paluster]|uniref:Uncharacterized protein n=1 Tax=Sphagnurus paluster TaxID=117069 RepID=A0A9P7GK00_9AGAR|nr:hypothetical protein H0H81_011364 [Sphagnurus paluster]
MLQLPTSSAQSPETSSQDSFATRTESPERLKMKTRVAIRNRNPHRFQIVPLGDVSRFVYKDQAPTRDRKQPLTLARSPGTGTGIVRSGQKLRTSENTVSVSAHESSKVVTSDSPRTLSERNTNIQAATERPVPQPTAPVPTNPLQTSATQPNETTPCPQAPETPSRRRKPHFKSPSLGNIRTKPNHDYDLESTPVPRAVACRKRTNTLSASHSQRSIHNGPVGPAALDPTKKDPLKRHAIYTQSLYVPLNDRPLFFQDPNPGPADTSVSVSLSLSSSSPLDVFPFRSSIASKPKNPVPPSSKYTLPMHTGNALGFINVPSPLEHRFESQSSSLSSAYSLYSLPSVDELSHPPLAETRPLTQYALPDTERKAVVKESPLLHSKIVSLLLLEVDEALREWSDPHLSIYP